MPVAGRPLEQPGGDRAAAERDRAQAGRAARRPASRRRTSIVGTSEASVTSPASSAALTRSASKRSWSTAVVPLIAQRTSTAEAADVVERQRAEPAVGRVDAERAGGGGGAGGVVGEGQLDRLGLAGGAGGVDDGVDGVRDRARCGAPTSVRAAPSSRRLGRIARAGTGAKAAPRRGTAWSSAANARPGGWETRTRSPASTPCAASTRAAAVGALVELGVGQRLAGGHTAGWSGRARAALVSQSSRPGS